MDDRLIVLIGVLVALSIYLVPWLWVRFRAYRALTRDSHRILSKPYDVGRLAIHFRAADESDLNAPVCWQDMRPESLSVDEGSRMASEERIDSNRNFDAAAVGAGAFGATMVHRYVAIDEHIYRGIGHMSGENLDALGDLSSHLQTYESSSFWTGLSEANISNVKGHIGESYAAEHFEKAGIQVDWPETGNQAGWDLLIEGHEVNVKTIQDASNLSEHFADYPGIPAVIPGDAKNIPEDAIYFDPSGSNEDLLEALNSGQENLVIVDESLSVADVTTQTEAATDTLLGSADALDAAAGAIPVATLFLSGWREARLFRAQKTDLITSAKNTSLDVAGTGGGAFIGMKGGALVGLVFGPPGALIGSMLGGIGGAVAGRMASNEIKQKSYKKALATLREEDEQLKQRTQIAEDRVGRELARSRGQTQKELHELAAQERAKIGNYTQQLRKWRIEQERIERGEAEEYLEEALQELRDSERQVYELLGDEIWLWPHPSRSQHLLIQAAERIRNEREELERYKRAVLLASGSAIHVDRGVLFERLARAGTCRDSVQNSLRNSERKRRVMEARLRKNVQEAHAKLAEARVRAHEHMLDEMARFQKEMRRELKPSVVSAREAAEKVRREAEKLGIV